MEINIKRSADIKRTARVLQLEGIFDVPPSQRSENSWSVTLPIEEKPWKIGLIVGPSGSGKTTLAKEAFAKSPFVSANVGYDWPADQSVVDGFPAGMSIKDITAALSSVGFSSPPSWVRPFRYLSTGEQFRATVARAIVDPSPLVVIDEFTSVVDRTVAQIGSAAVAKAVRRTTDKQIICVTCHYDVEPWLCPDWVIEMPHGNFAWRCLRRPPIKMEITRSDYKTWPLFSKHHYLNQAHDKRAACFLATIDDTPVGWCSVIHWPHPRRSCYREHRLVVSPDFQGVGIGNKLSDYVASLYKSTGKPYRGITSHPGLIQYRAKSPVWKVCSKPTTQSMTKTAHHAAKHLRKTASFNRLTVSSEFVGPANNTDAKGFGLI